MRWKAIVLTLLALAPGAGGATAAVGSETADAGPATDRWARILAAHVVRGGVNYSTLKGAREDLDLYLDSLGATTIDGWSDARQTAFWINAYNAVVLRFVIDRYPRFPGVKKVDGFFDRLAFRVAGEERTLDQMEDRALAFGEARVHFALVCASTSCPDLRAEPYRADDLDAQLEDQTRGFLANAEKGLRYDAKDNTLWLSSIFKWYAGDFTGGSTWVAFFARGKLMDWILPHLPEELAETIRRRDPAIRYLDYDWGLNDRSSGS